MRKAKILILLSCFLPILGIGQNINLVNGVPVTILDGTSLDHVIPADAGSVEISVRGGDGGQVRFSGIFCDDTTIKGGQGALIDVTFEVGNGPRQIPPGSRLRTFIGGRGAGWSQACGAPGAFFGGGGGSSAIFYLPPGADEFGVNWRMLVVAGGGGGAARPSAGFDWPGGSTQLS